MLDRKAIEIIEKSSGATEEEIVYAKNADYYNDAEAFPHNLAMQVLPSYVKSIGLNFVVDNFIYSLSNRDLIYRSPIIAYSCAMNMPTHAFPISEYEMHCDICGDNSYHKTRNYNRVVSWMANGMLLSKDVFTLMHALDISEKFEHKIPSADDLEILNNIFKVIKNCPENLSAPKFEIYLGKQKVLKSNRDERQNLLETFGYMGILESNDHKGFNRHFTNMSYQNEAIRSPRDDYEYPLRWWKVEDGLNKEAIDFWFGKYEKQLVY